MHDRIERRARLSSGQSGGGVHPSGSDVQWTAAAGSERPLLGQADGQPPSTGGVGVWKKRSARTVAGGTMVALGEPCLARSSAAMETRDLLTGLPDRRTFETILRQSLKAWFRHGIPACLLVLDLDYFRVVNERLGYEAGDEVLRQVAVLVAKHVRETDPVSRYGGGAFAVLLPAVDLPLGMALAERLRNTIERHVFLLNEGQVRLTASVGVTPLGRTAIESVGKWIATADAALDLAKLQGRNCVVSYGPVPSVPAYVALAVAA
ncbi:MAG: GGDEF domain-containing protein [Nitrospira sp.]|nr:GGDEF domain-containing protein [Nitrospira sp.]